MDPINKSIPRNRNNALHQATIGNVHVLNYHRRGGGFRNDL